MHAYIVAVFLCCFVASCTSKINVDELKCLVCETTIKELGKVIEKIDPTKTVRVGNARLDDKGNYKQKTVPLARSEIHLSEVVEEVCSKIDSYVRVKRKSDGKLLLMKLINDDGQMNSDLSNVDIIQDEDLNESVMYNCQSLVEVNEDEIIDQFINDPKNAVNICHKISSCGSSYGPHKEL